MTSETKPTLGKFFLLFDITRGRANRVQALWITLFGILLLITNKLYFPENVLLLIFSDYILILAFSRRLRDLDISPFWPSCVYFGLSSCVILGKTILNSGLEIWSDIDRLLSTVILGSIALQRMFNVVASLFLLTRGDIGPNHFGPEPHNFWDMTIPTHKKPSALGSS